MSAAGEARLRQSLCDAAQAWLGCREADGSHRPIIDVYNAIRPLPGGYAMGYADPWCAAFVSAAAARAGLLEIVFPHCSCEGMIALYKAAGRWEERDFAVPRAGDLIFYDWQDGGFGDCRGQADHVGVVLSLDGDLVRVIEGNKSDAVGIRTLAIDARCIRGYGQPDYAALAAREEGGSAEAAARPAPTQARQPLPAPVVPAPAARCTVTLELPILRRGDRGEAVRTLQQRLIAKGYRCGPYGADGIFGDGTYGGLLRFQRGRQLEADAVAGPRTWRVLLSF